LQLREKGFTQEEVASLLKVGQATISRWEKEKNEEKNRDYAFLSKCQKCIKVENHSQNIHFCHLTKMNIF